MIAYELRCYRFVRARLFRRQQQRCLSPFILIRIESNSCPICPFIRPISRGARIALTTQYTNSARLSTIRKEKKRAYTATDHGEGNAIYLSNGQCVPRLEPCGCRVCATNELLEERLPEWALLDKVEDVTLKVSETNTVALASSLCSVDSPMWPRLKRFSVHLDDYGKDRGAWLVRTVKLRSESTHLQTLEWLGINGTYVGAWVVAKLRTLLELDVGDYKIKY